MFTDLARRSPGLRDRRTLTGWFYTSTHCAAVQAMRSEGRRLRRETKAHDMSELATPALPEVWDRLRPVLDDVMGELSADERVSILLRYFKNRPFADALNVSGTINFGGALNVSLLSGFTLAVGNSFDLFNYTSSTGSFSSFSLPALAGDLTWDLSSLYSNGIISVVGASALPEPSTYALMAGALALCLAAWRRRQTATVSR